MIHANLCVALLISHLIFLCGIEVNKHVCIHTQKLMPGSLLLKNVILFVLNVWIYC